MKSEVQVLSSSRPNAGAMVTPIAETPVVEPQVAETPVAETPAEETPEAPATPFTPAPMETGGAGDSRSWAEQMEAGEEVFQQSWPAKCTRSQSRRHEPGPQHPFPLQDEEGRLTSVTQLYKHAAVQLASPHNVVGQAIGNLHPDLLPQQATCLGNQVECMIVELHLTSSV